MPNFEEHAEKARDNIVFLDSFALNLAHDWAMTVMFYTAVHMVEALMFKVVNNLKATGKRTYQELHCTIHDVRERQTKDLMPEIYEPYCQLSKAAKTGRYKAYKFRDTEVKFAFTNHFMPVVGYFNDYCRDNSLSINSTLIKLDPRNIDP
jgi:hypothetical protein